MKYIISFLFIMIVIGCTKSPEPAFVIQKVSNDISDLVSFPQESSPYLKNANIDNIEIDQNKYEKYYFRPWNNPAIFTKEEAMWPFESYKFGSTYGENLHLLSEDFFISMKENSNFDAYSSLNIKATTLKLLNIRAFPTNKPLFRDPSEAGEGFPFDYMQNSSVGANKPVLISHYSKDKQWAYIFTSFTAGWVETDDLVVVERKNTKLWQKAEQVFLVKDGVPIYSEKGKFLFKSRVGMMLPLIDEDALDYTVLTVSSYKYSQANYHKSKISKIFSRKGIVSFNEKNLKLIMDEVAKSKYGWGGNFDQRDCSSTLRDMFTPFGIWLPRNSFRQAKRGNIVKLIGLSDVQKLELIKKEAIPFKTLLHKKGHILLYVGIYNDEVIAFHNVWGVKTKKGTIHGRVVIGKTIYSTLNLGQNQEYFNKEASILKHLDSFSIIVD